LMGGCAMTDWFFSSKDRPASERSRRLIRRTKGIQVIVKGIALDNLPIVLSIKSDS
jgi:hypothetical protein